jgi:hypothetical protein
MTGRIGMNTDALTKLVVERVRDEDAGAKVVMKEQRVVNGREITALQITQTIDKTPTEWFGYFHGGSAGSISVIVMTLKPALVRNHQDFTEFLNGLEISDQDQDLPPPAPQLSAAPASAPDPKLTAPDNSGFLAIGSGMRLQYDPNTWKHTKSDGNGRFEFRHSSGDAYALVISESESLSMDLLPEIALLNAQRLAPNAAITLREKRKVRGTDVWFVKIASEYSGVPFVYCSYDYTGKNGTVQVITYTAPNLLSEYESDFMAFLNGLSISELGNDQNATAIPSQQTTASSQPTPAASQQKSKWNPAGPDALDIILLSDPQGVDFQPYLTQTVASVRRNWLAAIPVTELRRDRRVEIQFAINKSGLVPKLVIVSVPELTPWIGRQWPALVYPHPFLPFPRSTRETKSACN